MTSTKTSDVPGVVSDAIVRPVSQLSDEELFDEIREQVNRSRNGLGHQVKRTRELSAEAQKRGWNLRRPNIGGEVTPEVAKSKHAGR